MEMTKEAAYVAAHEPMRDVPVNSGGMRSTPGEFLSFHLDAEEYGIEILKVQEIRSYETPTRIPNSPSFVRGVVNLRGVIVPIVDLRTKLALDTAEYDNSTVVIVLNLADRVMGVVVDRVSDVVQLSAEQIKPAPALACSVDAGFITGMGSIRADDRERLLILLDIEGLMLSGGLGLADRPSD